MIVLGGLLAAWMGGRFGRKWPIIIGLGLNTLAGASLAVCEHGGLYIALLVVWNFAYYFLVPFMMGALAALDDQGRWAVAGDSLWNAGIVPGPVIAGALVESSGYVPLAGMSLVTGFACMLIAMIIGTVLGLSAGFFGGRVDMFVSFLITVRLALPAFLVAIAVVALVGGSMQVVILVLGCLIWDRFAVVLKATSQQIR